MTHVTATILCIANLLLGTDSIAGENWPPNPFFAMNTGTKDTTHQTPQSQVEMLKELGYDGIGYEITDDIPQMLSALDAAGLKLFTLYLGVNIDPDRPKYDPRLPRTIESLHGRDTIVWLQVQSERYKPSSPEADPEAIALIRGIADMAQRSGLRVALYPHAGALVERIEDAVRVARQVDRENVGVTFNLCHWLKVKDKVSAEVRLRESLPYLAAVTINGADTDGDWNRLIQNLDSGSFDLYGFLETLKSIGYTGPVGLQGYGIGGSSHENLRRSMNAWQEFSTRLATEKP